MRGPGRIQVRKVHEMAMNTKMMQLEELRALQSRTTSLNRTEEFKDKVDNDLFALDQGEIKTLSAVRDNDH